MPQRPTGPAAALFDDGQLPVPDELFAAPVGSPDQLRLQTLEARANELYDFFLKVYPNGAQFLPINRIHRNQGK